MNTRQSWRLLVEELTNMRPELRAGTRECEDIPEITGGPRGGKMRPAWGLEESGA